MTCEDRGPRCATECDECSPSRRNRYFRGKLMTVADYQAEQRYMIARRRTINRTVLGWGVVTGFDLRWDEDARAIRVRRGVAIDPAGRELIACDDVRLDEAEDLLWIVDGRCGPVPSGDAAPGRYLLSAYYAERPIDGVRIETGCGEAVCEDNHVCETVVFGLSDPEACALPFVQCCDDLTPRAGDQPAPLPEEPPRVADLQRRGVASLCVGGGDDPCCVPPLMRCGDLHVALGAGVPLAYVEVRQGACDLELGEPVPVIGCCDLTRIQDIGWRNWHRNAGTEIDRESFFSMFEAPTGQGETDPPVDTRFWICLTGPVQIASLSPDVVTMTLAMEDDREAVWNSVEIRIAALWIAPTSPGDPAGTTRGFRIMVDASFWRGEISRGHASGFRHPTRVVLRVHGNRIIDWRGWPIDADAVAYALPSGNGSAGGDFVSAWTVRPHGPNKPPYGDIPADTGTTAA